MSRCVKYILLAFVAVACLCCSSGGGDVDDPNPSVYYWRTVFRLDSTERAFLSQHDVKRMYVRYFDVVSHKAVAHPNATISFAQPVPEGIEVIPTIFIVNHCFRYDMDSIPEKLVDRVLQMNETNDVTGVRELQIDCDWTSQTQDDYFAFLGKVRALLKEHGMRLSVTIRLHQLNLPPPPADYGVLMMYNTGDFREKSDRNPILDYRDAYPYLKHLASYKLPLCSAWPCYSWNLLYSDNQFKGILYDVDLADSNVYREVAPGRHVVISSRALPEPNSDGSDMTWVNVGDSVITVKPTASQIMHIVEAVEKERPGINKQTIIYSLDKKSIQNYDNEFYQTLLNR